MQKNTDGTFTVSESDIQALVTKGIKEAVKDLKAEEPKKPGFLSNFFMGGIERVSKKVTEYNKESEALAETRRARLEKEEKEAEAQKLLKKTLGDIPPDQLDTMIKTLQQLKPDNK